MISSGELEVDVASIAVLGKGSIVILHVASTVVLGVETDAKVDVAFITSWVWKLK